ncbi:MAG TPA: SDR family oxidoreductase [Pseudolabrys sp.]|nr:SDR family oxidoreductase [Pseudolabrys sp.]
MRRRFSGRRILITGAASGIGRALAMRAANEKMRLILSDFAGDQIKLVCREVRRSGAEVVIAPGDVTTPQDRQAIFAAAKETFGGLDILINNAGVGANGHFIDLPAESLRQVMEVNFFACAENCRLAIPLLSRGEQPLIVNVSSMYGRRGVPDWAGYCASKFALCGFSEALRAELVRFGIDLMLVLPGLTRTNFLKNIIASGTAETFDFTTGLTPEVVASQIFDGMRKNRPEISTGLDATRLIWANRMLPRFIDLREKQTVRKQWSRQIADKAR